MTARALQGHIDECSWELLAGWARWPDRPDERVRLDVWIDGTIAALVVADIEAPDLVRAGVGDGRHRFRVDMTSVAALAVGDVHDIVVCDSEGTQLDGPTRLTRWSPGSFDGLAIADLLAFRSLEGTGIEIGALDAPQMVSSSAIVRHVDRASTDELREIYGEINAASIVDVSIIDDGQTLGTIADASLDFVIANNVIEHVEDPVGALANWHRVTRTGGLVLLRVPNPRESYDRGRLLTTLDHLADDHRLGPTASRAQHYLEWSTFVEGRVGRDAVERAVSLQTEGYPIHFHVWDEYGTMALIRLCTELTGRAFVVEHLSVTPRRHETVVLLRVESTLH